MPVSVGIRAFWRWLESSAGSGGVGAVQLGVSAIDDPAAPEGRTVVGQWYD